MSMKPITVSKLNNYIKRVLSSDPVLSDIAVVGEVSNLKNHATGVYFSLKDEDTKVSCYMPPSVGRQVTVRPQEGAKVVVYGYINVYERGGTYSVNVRNVEAVGLGDLAAAFEQLKERLAAAGYFDPAAKKPLPTFPKKVAVVTSPTGAAVQDIRKIITQKNDYVDLLIYPVLVQGPGAAPDIAAAIKDINENIKDVDVIITGRGGGSMEELWAFNEEIVAKAIFESEIPVISAVGHETDFTIADFVADRRAETPTAAANMAVPDTGELRMYLEDMRGRLMDNLRSNVAAKEERIRLAGLDAMKREIESRIRMNELKCKGYLDTLENLNPKNVMKRGYAAVFDKAGHFITSAQDLTEGDEVNTVLSDGSFSSRIIEIRR